MILSLLLGAWLSTQVLANIPGDDSDDDGTEMVCMGKIKGRNEACNTFSDSLADCEGAFTNPFGGGGQCRYVEQANCAEISSPCDCQDTCGWSSDSNTCVKSRESTTSCSECPNMEECVNNTCESAGCPNQYLSYNVCQCNHACHENGNCCADVADVCSMVCMGKISGRNADCNYYLEKASCEAAFKNPFGGAGQCEYVVQEACSLIKDPCECTDTCGWSTKKKACVRSREATTHCFECPSMEGCVQNTCASADCPMDYKPYNVCQCNKYGDDTCMDHGNCCDDVDICKPKCPEVDDETGFENCMKAPGCMYKVKQVADWEGNAVGTPIRTCKGEDPNQYTYYDGACAWNEYVEDPSRRFPVMTTDDPNDALAKKEGCEAACEREMQCVAYTFSEDVNGKAYCALLDSGYINNGVVQADATYVCGAKPSNVLAKEVGEMSEEDEGDEYYDCTDQFGRVIEGAEMMWENECAPYKSKCFRESFAKIASKMVDGLEHVEIHGHPEYDQNVDACNKDHYCARCSEEGDYFSVQYDPKAGEYDGGEAWCVDVEGNEQEGTRAHFRHMEVFDEKKDYCDKLKNCIKVMTGIEDHNDGRVAVYINNRLVSDPTKIYARGEQVGVWCYPDEQMPFVHIEGMSEHTWVGFVLHSKTWGKHYKIMLPAAIRPMGTGVAGSIIAVKGWSSHYRDQGEYICDRRCELLAVGEPVTTVTWNTKLCCLTIAECEATGDVVKEATGATAVTVTCASADEGEDGGIRRRNGETPGEVDAKYDIKAAGKGRGDSVVDKLKNDPDTMKNIREGIKKNTGRELGKLETVGDIESVSEVKASTADYPNCVMDEMREGSLPAGKVADISMDECAEACFNNPKCEAWVQNTNKNLCIMKRSANFKPSTKKNKKFHKAALKGCHPKGL